MQIELRQFDIQCLEAIRAAGGYAALSDCLVYFYRQDIEVSYDEIRDSFTRLLQGKFIACCFFLQEDIYRIKKRGEAALRGEITSFEERDKYVQLTNSQFLDAKIDAMEKMDAGENAPSRKSAGWNILSVFFWVLSLALLAGGIVFACLYQGAVGWRVGVCIIGLVLYIAIGTIDLLLCVPKCSHGMKPFLSIVNLPSYLLLYVILEGLQGL